MLPLLTTLSVLSSWYGPGFHGNLTANGERYNQNGLTAAHKTLPFGTRLRVCFNRCAVVRVNDKDTSLKNQPVGVLARCGGHPIQHIYCLIFKYKYL
jgi:hypothetical protein